ncbi:MAG: protein disulfide isomerase family protein, partial [Candidatus Lutacidiplasmatales archaeon]
METLTAADFRKTQLLRDGTWVVAFLADWCPFCRSFRPEFSPLEAGSGFRVA